MAVAGVGLTGSVSTTENGGVNAETDAVNTGAPNPLPPAGSHAPIEPAGLTGIAELVATFARAATLT